MKVFIIIIIKGFANGGPQDDSHHPRESFKKEALTPQILRKIVLNEAFPELLKVKEETIKESNNKAIKDNYLVIRINIQLKCQVWIIFIEDIRIREIKTQYSLDNL